MVSANKADSSWKDRFESLYSAEERGTMSPTQKERAIKEILDENSRQVGSKVYKHEHQMTKTDKDVTDALGHSDGVKTST